MKLNSKQRLQSKLSWIKTVLLAVVICSVILSGCGKEIDITPLFGQWKNVSEISNDDNPQTIRIGKYGDLVRFAVSTDYYLQMYDENDELCGDSDCTIRPKNDKSGSITFYGGSDRVRYSFKDQSTIILTGSIEGTFILDNEP